MIGMEFMILDLHSKNNEYSLPNLYQQNCILGGLYKRVFICACIAFLACFLAVTVLLLCGAVT